MTARSMCWFPFGSHSQANGKYIQPGVGQASRYLSWSIVSGPANWGDFEELSSAKDSRV